MNRDDSRADLVLDAVKLVRTQLEIRDRRRANEPEERVRAAATALSAMRRAWWTRVQQADRQPGGHPLAQLTTRLALEPDEVDILIIVLVAQMDGDVHEAIVRGRTPDLTADTIVDLLFHEPKKRFDARRHLTPVAPLVRHGLISIDAPEVRPTEALMTFALGRPLEAGPLARYCQLVAPQHAWAHAILPERDKERVWELVAGLPTVRKSLDEWGLGRILPRARGLVLLFAGPPGTGKASLAHGLAQRLGRPVLKIHTPSLAAAGVEARAVLAEVLGVAATSGAVALLEDYELLLDARGPGATALLEALDRHHDPDGVLILTANDPTREGDAALSRRIQLRLDVAAPDAAARAAIWRVHLPSSAATSPLAQDVDVDALAAEHPITGARIRDAVLLGLAMMAARGEPRLTMAMLRDAAAQQERQLAPSRAMRAIASTGVAPP